MKFTAQLLSAFLVLIILSCNKKADLIPTTVTPVDTIPAMGKTVNGGVIFYLDNTGKHGLMAAVSDLPHAAEWGCEGLECNATGMTQGTGANNTAAIVNG